MISINFEKRNKKVAAVLLANALCGKGEQYNAVTKECDKCVKGKYKDVEGNTEMCMMCPTDKTTLGTGSTDSSDCSQTLCPIGTYYKVTAGTTQCIPCEKDQCKAGNGFDTFDQTCKICRPGEYNDAMGNNADFCKQCPSGKTSTQSGASACNVVVDDPVIEEKQVNIPMRLVFFVALDSCDDTSNLKIIYDLILNTIRTLFNAISNSSYNNNKRGFCRGNKCDNLVFVGLSTCGARGNSAGRRRRAADTEITVDFALKNNDEIVFGDLSNITETPLCNPGEKRNNELCENCPAGSSGTDGLVCSQCGTGQYQDVVGQTSCKACPEKTFNNKNGSTTADDCLPYKDSTCYDNNNNYNNNNIANKDIKDYYNKNKRNITDKDTTEFDNNNNIADKDATGFYNNNSIADKDATDYDNNNNIADKDTISSDYGNSINNIFFTGYDSFNNSNNNNNYCNYLT
ncbi:hypothetical protein MAR_027987 [Mya arenaria]|uniref:Tyrosine-protein kinase ephrin type A/B receptor-like domain-containing protein n=1 Tax=Mya arenaria TaxID=6604 RepID=A0ABY7DEY5_MYAAR|nr:hypothetical protein MAR_027987 [Mya arenaria]